jgi:hypothetical protein
MKQNKIFLIVLFLGSIGINNSVINLGDDLSGWHYLTFCVVLFSGENNEELVACPWLINASDGTIIGPNNGFRNFFQEEFKSEIGQYNVTIDISLTYENTWHEFHNCSQWFANDTEGFFDPYYALIDVEFVPNNDTTRTLWRTEIAPAIMTSLPKKWFISDFLVIKGIIDKGIPGFSFSESALFVTLSIVIIFKRQRTK